MVEDDMVRRRGQNGLADLARKSWSAEEEQRFLQLMLEFSLAQGPVRRKKGKEKFAPMAAQLNREFHEVARTRYPVRSWKNLRVKSNNLRSKYEILRRKSVADGSSASSEKAEEAWPNYALCMSVFGKEPVDTKEEFEIGRDSEDDGERSPTASARAIQTTSRAPEENGDMADRTVFIEALRTLEKTTDDQRAASDKRLEERDRRFQLDVERLRLETRNVLEVELERLRNEQSMKMKELEMKIMLMIRSAQQQDHASLLTPAKGLEHQD
mmetsp:Transcript_28169/g.110705  ORF Transcript_28169/g.110705 Transcript_28169/m.110705 type:complete len:269 (-) Transcript_28169:157-963(-)